MDGARIARGILRAACGRVQVMCPACCCDHRTAGPDVIRGSGPDHFWARDAHRPQAGSPDRRLDRFASRHHHPRNWSAPFDAISTPSSAAHLAPWIGLVPRQNSSGGKERLGSISKQGDRYLRRLLVVRATAVHTPGAHAADLRHLLAPEPGVLRRGPGAMPCVDGTCRSRRLRRKEPRLCAGVSAAWPGMVAVIPG